MFKKIVAFSSLVSISLISSYSHSGTIGSVDYFLPPPNASELPAGCSFGRAKTGNVEDVSVSLEDAQSAYDSSLDLIYNSEDQTLQENAEDAKQIYDLWESIKSLSESLDYLRIEGPAYVTQNVSSRFKANTFDMYASVAFHNNEFGYVGRDKSNYEANAYKYLSFEKERGAGLVWVTRDDMCSAMGVWVQQKPTITGTLDRANGSLKIQYHLDNLYSRSVREKINPTITVHQGGGRVILTVPAIGQNKKVSSSSREVTIKKKGEKYFGELDRAIYLPHYWDYDGDISITIEDGGTRATTTIKSWQQRVPEQIADPSLGPGEIFAYNKGKKTDGCTLTQNYSAGGGNTIYTKYKLICENDELEVEVTNTSGRCDLQTIPRAGYSISGDCEKWAVSKD